MPKAAAVSSKSFAPECETRAADHAACAASELSIAEVDRAAENRQIVLGLLGMAGLSWLGLYLWSVSQYAQWLDHGSWLTLGLAQSLCLWTGEAGWTGVAIGVAAWLLMLSAMMLPTVAPMLMIVNRAARSLGERILSIGAAITGYLLLWIVFGLAAHGLDAVFQEIVSESPFLLIHGWVIGAGVVALAGLYQLSPLKDSCRNACRTPLREAAMLGQTREEGGSLPAGAFRAGLSHGVACIGCCWALMLLMFVVGMSNLAWMLALTAVMAVEKNFEIGARLGAPLGMALLAASAVIVGTHL